MQNKKRKKKQTEQLNRDGELLMTLTAYIKLRKSIRRYARKQKIKRQSKIKKIG